MVDQTDPNNQFHPYQPATETPVSERPTSGISGMLRKIGIGDDVIDRVKSGVGGVNMDSLKNSWNNVDVKSSVNKARDYARSNPGKVLGGLALAVIGAGLMAQRSRSFSR